VTPHGKPGSDDENRLPPLTIGPALRALRHLTDLSQRELAARAEVPLATLARIESGATRNPLLLTVDRLVRAAGGTIQIVARADGSPVAPLPTDELRDEGGRRFPAHLEVRRVRSPKDWSGAWWAYWYELPERLWPKRVPPYTYDGRRLRDLRRRARGTGAG
jgi:transcriptional regulator with XRE-family HTH domain